MLRKVSTILIAMLLFVPWAFGQSTFGGIVGVVKDPGQRSVAGAQLTLTNLDDRVDRDASTDDNGGFELINLKAGRYELVVHADGFADYKVSLQLDARQSLRLDVPLKLASASQSIEVNSDAGPVINTENGTIGDSKDFQQITRLPVNPARRRYDFHQEWRRAIPRQPFRISSERRVRRRGVELRRQAA